MESGEYSAPAEPALAMAESWQATLVLGVLTLILGIIVSFHPTGSLNFVAVLIGILMILWGSSTWSAYSAATNRTGYGWA